MKKLWRGPAALILLGLVIASPDTTHAENDVQGITIDKDGNVTVTYQKVLVDDTDGTGTNDGGVQTLTLQPADAQAFLIAIQPVLTPLVNANSALPAASQSSTDTQA